MTVQTLTISDITIKQDAFGRFCLNDLHKASGNEERHKPKYWVALQQTQELIAELLGEKSKGGIPPLEQNQPLAVIHGGKLRGTYADKELVYAYATWISAKFFLRVIRAYDSLVNPKPYGLKEAAPTYLTPAMKRHINRQVAFLAKTQVGTDYGALSKSIQDQFNVNKREFIPASKYREVCAFLNCEPDPKALEGELLEPAKLEYQLPKGMVLVPVDELEALRHEKEFDYVRFIDLMNKSEAAGYVMAEKSKIRTALFFINESLKHYI